MNMSLGKKLFFGRLLFDFALCCWQLWTAAAGGTRPVYLEPMVWLAVTNPAVTLLSTTLFAGDGMGREWVWVVEYLITDAIIWGGLWVIIRWLNGPPSGPR
jgi:hypothetical protein